MGAHLLRLFQIALSVAHHITNRTTFRSILASIFTLQVIKLKKFYYLLKIEFSIFQRYLFKVFMWKLTLNV